MATSILLETGFGYIEHADGPLALAFGEGIQPQDLTVSTYPYRIIYSTGPGTGGSYVEGLAVLIEVTETDRFVFRTRDRAMVDGPLDNIGITSLTFANGVSWTTQDLLNELQQPAGRPLIQGTSNPDVLYGNEEPHVISGYGGDDTLISGSGDDIFDGGSGGNFFKFSQSWGNDVIRRTRDSSGHLTPASDVIEFDASVSAVNLSRQLVDGDLVLTDTRTGSTLRVENFLESNPQTNQNSLDTVVFSDGTQWGVGDLYEELKPTLPDPTPYADVITALTGDQVIDGRAGADTLTGGAGQDTLIGGIGPDVLMGGTVIEGGEGRDLLLAGAQATLIFKPGFGMDKLVGEGQYTLRFEAGITPDDLSFVRRTRGSEGLLITLKSTGDNVLLTGSAFLPTLSIAFEQGPDLSGATLMERIVDDETPAGIQIYGTQGVNETITVTGDGDLIVSPLGGADIFEVSRNTTIDFLRFEVAPTIIRLPQGVRPEDVIIQTPRHWYQPSIGLTPDSNMVIDTGNVGGKVTLLSNVSLLEILELQFADGTVWDAGTVKQKAYRGTAGSDVLYAAPDKAETFTHVLGDGNDSLYGFSTGDFVELGNREVKFDRAPGDVRGLIATHLGSGETLFVADNPGGLHGRFRFSDGTELSPEQAISYDHTNPLVPAGTSGDDYLLGTSGADTLWAWEGNDTLVGNHDNAPLTDLLIGGAGNDTYLLPMLTNMIDYGGTTKYTGRWGSQVIESANEGVDEIVLSNGFFGWMGPPSFDLPDHIENLTALDGAYYIKGNALDNLITYQGAAASLYRIYYVNGEGGQDTLLGGVDGDFLLGGLGNDLLVGRGGSDTLEGGQGADTYTVSKGDGQDLIHADDQDTIALHSSIARNDMIIGSLGATVPNAVVLSFKNSTDSITLDNAGQWNGLKISFADGSSMTGSQLVAAASPLNLTGTSGKNVLSGQGANDTLSGLGGNDTLSGGAGDDRLVGGKGNDTYLFSRGDGQDTIIDKDTTWFNSDTLRISGATNQQLWLTRSGNNLNVSIIGTADKVTIQDWYVGSSNRVESIRSVDSGKALSYLKVNALVNAMSAFTPPAQGQTTLPPDVQSNLSKVIASSWS